MHSLVSRFFVIELINSDFNQMVSISFQNLPLRDLISGNRHQDVQRGGSEYTADSNRDHRDPSHVIPSRLLHLRIQAAVLLPRVRDGARVRPPPWRETTSTWR